MQLRLYGIPEAISAAVCPFADLAGAVDTVIATIQSGVPVARIELLDELQMQRRQPPTRSSSYAEAPTLFFEFHGTAAGVEEQARLVAEIADEHRRRRLPAGRPGPRTATGSGRRATTPTRRPKALRPGAEARATDVCVPISRLAECILETRADLDADGLLAPIVGHVGDGNFHLTFLLDPNDPARARRAPRRSTTAWSSARSPWAAPAPASTASAPARCAYLEAEHGDGVDADAPRSSAPSTRRTS